ncbi:MAG: cobalamin-dependent protein [Candidatus Niyogibacteria bacterium]|nr:MAG: cobalamin-dependent protein [Candidatus Niyogibacteria bacterium]
MRLADELAEGFAALHEPAPAGEFPYTRGIHPGMYRDKKWTIRQFAGHGLAFDTNARWKMLLGAGTTGLSTPFDLPTLMGFDSDDPICRGEVGWDGVAVDTIRDMEELFNGIAIDQLTVSMTISGPAAIIWAMYIAMAQKRGIAVEKLGGTIQNDILKEFIAQREWIFPEGPSMRLVTDTIEFAAKYMPRWNPISISGYHIREAGATAVQELAFTLADGVAYAREAVKRGLKIDDFAPRLSFFFDIHNDFLEEIAKLRAARKLWAHIMRHWFGAKNYRSEWCRMHVQTAGCTLTREESLNNIVRVAIQALAGALGGAQSMHTNSYDEVMCTPTEGAARVAARTQQILQEETGICAVVDALGGSYFIEESTQRIFEEALAEIQRIEQIGGMIEAVKAGYPQRVVQESAREYDRGLRSGAMQIVGVTKYCLQEELDEPESVARELETRRGFEERQLESLAAFKRERSAFSKISEARSALDDIRRVAETEENIMPFLIRAATSGATLGEIVSAMKQVWGAYEDKGLYVPAEPDKNSADLVRIYRLKKPLRVLLAKGGLDGHDRPIYLIAPFLKNLGAEVIYPGLHLSTLNLARVALQENVDVVAVSTHIGSPVVLFEDLIQNLRIVGHERAKVIGGGIIRRTEADLLKKSGVERFFTAGPDLYKNIAEFLKEGEEKANER